MSNILATTYDDARTVTLSDVTNDPLGPFAGLLVTVAGTLKITTVQNHDATFAAVVVGQIVPVATLRVWATGTSATVLGLSSPPFKPKVTGP